MNTTFVLPDQNGTILEFVSGTKDVRKREKDLSRCNWIRINERWQWIKEMAVGYEKEISGVEITEPIPKKKNQRADSLTFHNYLHE